MRSICSSLSNPRTPDHNLLGAALGPNGNGRIPLDQGRCRGGCQAEAWAEAWGAVAEAVGRDDWDGAAAGVWAGLEATGRGGRLGRADAAGGG